MSNEALNPQQFIYHMTRSSNRESIERHGLEARDASTIDPNDVMGGTGVYGFTKRMRAIKVGAEMAHLRRESHDLYAFRDNPAQMAKDPMAREQKDIVLRKTGVPPEQLKRLSVRVKH